MKEIIRKKMAASPVLRWTVLGLVSFTMLTGYVIADVMAPLKTLLEQQARMGQAPTTGCSRAVTAGSTSSC